MFSGHVSYRTYPEEGFKFREQSEITRFLTFTNSTSLMDSHFFANPSSLRSGCKYE